METNSSPQWMTFDERMKEVACILAAGILRRKRREMNHMKKDSSFPGFGLDVSLEKSVHTNKPLPKGESR